MPVPPEDERRDDHANELTDDARLQALREKLDARAHSAPQVDAEGRRVGQHDRSGIAQAWRISSEFIAGIVVGGALGYAIDYFAGTSPFGLIIFLLLGFGAAILNVLRATGKAAPSRLRMPNDDS